MKLNKSWFTLIELLITMTIFTILVIMSFVPYQYYTHKARVKLASKDISQSILEVKNLAVNWYDLNWINQSLALYFDKSSPNVLKYYTYNYSSWILNNPFKTNYLLKEKKLPDGVIINDISGMDKMWIYFSSIYWSWYFLDSLWNTLDLEKIDINISYKNSSDPNLNKKVIFYKKTNLTDY